MAAYIQGIIPSLKWDAKYVNPLPAVMGFLYTSYIVIYAVISPLIGKWLDGYTIRANMAPTTGAYTASDILNEQKRDYFYWIAGVFFSLMSVLIFFNTFTPKNSWALNPENLGVDRELTDDDINNEKTIVEKNPMGL